MRAKTLRSRRPTYRKGTVGPSQKRSPSRCSPPAAGPIPAWARDCPLGQTGQASRIVRSDARRRSRAEVNREMSNRMSQNGDENGEEPVFITQARSKTSRYSIAARGAPTGGCCRNGRRRRLSRECRRLGRGDPSRQAGTDSPGPARRAERWVRPVGHHAARRGDDDRRGPPPQRGHG